MYFHKYSEKCSSLTQKTTSHLLRITLKGRLRVSKWTITRESFVHKPMVKFLGGSLKKSCFGKFLKVLLVSHKTIHKAFRIKKTLHKQNPLLEMFLFSIFTTTTVYFGFNKPLSTPALILACGTMRTASQPWLKNNLLGLFIRRDENKSQCW